MAKVAFKGKLETVRNMDGTNMTDEQILAELAQADGAILHWQVTDETAFKAAHVAGVVKFDADADCYVHPLAIEACPGDWVAGWVMPE